jgi:anaerobic selenocysteine-containing dehydrogenase
MIGRPGCGLLPLRGHSNVQGIGSMGVVPALKEAAFDAMQNRYGDIFPNAPGLDTMACMEAAHRGDMDFAMCLGGNLFGSNPDATFAAGAMQQIGTTVHLSTTLNTGHVRGRSRETIILPVLARDESPQSTTQESMFNFVRFSEGGRPRHEGPRCEVQVIADLAARGVPSPHPIDLDAMRSHAAIREAISTIVPGYEAINEAEEFHIEGRTFHSPQFKTSTGRVQIQDIDIPVPEPLATHEVRMMTIRSEGQFNTVVYEDVDVYRGIDRRDAILLNADDMNAWGISQGDAVDITTEAGSMRAYAAAFDMARRSAAMYFPECNGIVPRRLDPSSKTPGFKGFTATVKRS